MTPRLLATAVVVAIAVSLAALPAHAAPARLVKADGQVWITPPDGKEKSAQPVLELAAGTRIRTGPRGTAELVFENGSVIKVRPNTSMSLSGNKRPQRKKKDIRKKVTTAKPASGTASTGKRG